MERNDDQSVVEAAGAVQVPTLLGVARASAQRAAEAAVQDVRNDLQEMVPEAVEVLLQHPSETAGVQVEAAEMVLTYS